MDVLADGRWESIFKEKPEVFTKEEKRAWLDQMTDVALGSDAFFPFGDNIDRAYKSGVKYVAQPGGSVRDDQVIETCDNTAWRWHLPVSVCSTTKTLRFSGDKGRQKKRQKNEAKY